MAKRILADVYCQNDFGPDYCLIEFVGPKEFLTDKLAATKALADQFGGTRGPLDSTEWWLSAMPFSVTWLRYEAVLDAEGEEPDWLETLRDDSFVEVPECWEPNLGEPDEYNRMEYEFSSVDCEMVKIDVHGDFEIEGLIKGTADSFHTAPMPVSEIVDEGETNG